MFHIRHKWVALERCERGQETRTRQIQGQWTLEQLQGGHR